MDYLRWLVTTFPNNRDRKCPLEPWIHEFNRQYLMCRVTVECTIGQLEHHFYILKREAPIKDPIMMAKLIQVCAMKHNMCNVADDDHDDLDEDEAGQIFIQPEMEVYEQEMVTEVSFGRP